MIRLSKTVVALTALCALSAGAVFAPTAHASNLEITQDDFVGKKGIIKSRFEGLFQMYMNEEMSDLLLEQQKLVTANFQKYTNITKDIEAWTSTKNSLKKVRQMYLDVEGYANSFETVERSYNEMYPGFQSVYESQGGVSFSKQAMNIHKTYRTQAKLSVAQSGIQLDQILADEKVVDDLMARSNTAIGNNQIQQVSNAMIGALIQEVQKLRQLQASQMQAYQTYDDYMVAVKEVEAAQNKEDLARRVANEKNAAVNRMIADREKLN